MVESILVKAQLPTVAGFVTNARTKLKRFLNPLPKVGQSAYFYVEERHWDTARVKCEVGNRSTHCVLAQAIAEQFKLPYVSVAGAGDVAASDKPMTYDYDSDDYPTAQYYFDVDETGAKLIQAFDRMPPTYDPEAYKPKVFPVMVTLERVA